jgi:hypothetical protein
MPPSAWPASRRWNAPGISTGFDPQVPIMSPNLPLAWYLIFFAVFALFPFLFLKKFARPGCSVGRRRDGRACRNFS